MNNKNKFSGYIMVFIGFGMILFNAINYVFGFGNPKPAFSILGIVFLAIGLKIARSQKI